MMLEVDELTHQYGGETVLDSVSFGLQAGELVALLGPSGCGKTTIVQSIAGHIRPTAGRVRLRGKNLTYEPPESRDIGLMFQQSTLYPHMTVRENVEYGLAARNVGREKRRRTVSEMLALVELDEQRDAYPDELSGGQRRRVELARALAPQPDVLLLDEPLSALDRSLRYRLQEEIARIQRETGVTTLFVTHDQEEAMTLADRLVVMHEGTVSGIGEPRRLYESPPTPFIASFLGRSNSFRVTAVCVDPLQVDLAGTAVTPGRTQADVSKGDELSCHIRPDRLTLDGELSDQTVAIPGTVSRVVDVGRQYDVTVRTETGDDLLVEQSGEPPSPGEQVTIALSEQDLVIFDDV